MKTRWIPLMLIVAMTCLASESIASDEDLVKAIKSGNISEIKANLTKGNVNRELNYAGIEQKAVPLVIALMAHVSTNFDVLMNITRILLESGAKPSLARSEEGDLYTELYIISRFTVAKTKEEKLEVAQMSELAGLFKSYGAELNQTKVSRAKKIFDKASITARVTITVKPSDAQMRIIETGQKYIPKAQNEPGEYEILLKSGSYDIVVEKPGYIAKKKTIEVPRPQPGDIDGPWDIRYFVFLQDEYRVDLDSITVQLADTDQERFLLAGITLETSNKQATTAILSEQDQIRDVLIAVLQNKTYKSLRESQKTWSGMQKLQKKLLKKLHRHKNWLSIKAVTFSNFVIQ